MLIYPAVLRATFLGDFMMRCTQVSEVYCGVVPKYSTSLPPALNWPRNFAFWRCLSLLKVAVFI
jgi:hypothetical protein